MSDELVVDQPETGAGGQEHGDLTVKVHAPRDPEPKRFVFPKTETVAASAAHAAKKFGYTGGTPSFQNRHGEVLDRNLTLAAAHVHDHATLELVDVGGGV